MNERGPARVMVSAYRDALGEIEANVRDLLTRRARADYFGGTMESTALSTRLSLLYSRVRSIEDTVANTVRNSRLPEASVAQMEAMAPRAFALGADLGYARLEGAGVRFNRMGRDAAELAAARLAPGTNARQWVERFAIANAEATTQTLVRSVVLGRGVPEMVRAVRGDLDSAGVARVRTFVRTEMIGAMRDGNLNAYRANPDVVKGWVWNAAPSACAICHGMHGTTHPLGEPMYSHPNCRCSMDPITPTMADLVGSPMDDTAPVYGDPNDRLRTFTSRERVRILGPTRARAFDAGTLDVRAIPTPTSHPVWGPGLRAKRLNELDLAVSAAPPAPPALPRLPDLTTVDGIRELLNGPLKDFDPDARLPEPPVLKWLTKRLGYDDLPTLLDDAEWDDVIAREELPRMWRGVSGRRVSSDPQQAFEMASFFQEQFQTGRMFVGRGMYGNGTYVASDTRLGRAAMSTREARWDALNTARGYADQESGAVIELTLKPGARIADFESREVMDRYREWEQGMRRAVDSLRDTEDRTRTMNAYAQSDMRDFGTWAVLNGYDAIHIRSEGYFVILNRAQVYVRRRIFRGNTAESDFSGAE